MEPSILGTVDGIWAVSKPSGLRVHPANDDGAPDLIAWLASQPELPPGLVPVHRLDAQTSGIVLCAATPERRREVSQWFADGLVGKGYLALVYGIARRKGVVQRPLQDARRKRPLKARTRYRRRELLGRFSLLEAWPETGRKHQIRRHLHGIGHPIVGDERYRPRRKLSVPAFPGRLWLHAAQLVLPDGTTVTAPLPEALLSHLDTLRQQLM